MHYYYKGLLRHTYLRFAVNALDVRTSIYCIIQPNGPFTAARNVTNICHIFYIRRKKKLFNS